MEHPDWPALVAAVVADPDDDTVRLAAADFLEEHGDADRAAFVRAEVELARLEAGGPGKNLDAIDELRKRERAYLGPLSVYRSLWAAEACPELVRLVTRAGRGALEVEGAERLAWRRGFVERVTCSAEEWSRHGAAVRQRNPVLHLWLTEPAALPRDQWYAMMTALIGLRRLCVINAPSPLVEWLRGWLPGVDVDWIPW